MGKVKAGSPTHPRPPHHHPSSITVTSSSPSVGCEWRWLLSSGTVQGYRLCAAVAPLEMGGSRRWRREGWKRGPGPGPEAAQPQGRPLRHHVKAQPGFRPNLPCSDALCYWLPEGSLPHTLPSRDVSSDWLLGHSQEPCPTSSNAIGCPGSADSPSGWALPGGLPGLDCPRELWALRKGCGW